MKTRARVKEPSKEDLEFTNEIFGDPNRRDLINYTLFGPSGTKNLQILQNLLKITSAYNFFSSIEFEGPLTQDFDSEDLLTQDFDSEDLLTQDFDSEDPSTPVPPALSIECKSTISDSIGSSFFKTSESTNDKKDPAPRFCPLL